MMNKKDLEFEISENNIFSDLGLDQSEDLIVKAKLLKEVISLIKASGLTQADVASKLCTTQPKVSNLISGKLSVFSTETLMHYLCVLGCRVEISVRKPQNSGIFKNVGRFSVVNRKERSNKTNMVSG